MVMHYLSCDLICGETYAYMSGIVGFTVTCVTVEWETLGGHAYWGSVVIFAYVLNIEASDTMSLVKFTSDKAEVIPH